MEITIFGKTIPLYGLMFFLGIAAAAIAAIFLIKRRKISGFDFTCAAIYTMIGAVVGSKVLYLLVSVKQIIAYAKAHSFMDTFVAFYRGGFVFYGGLLGGILGLLIYGWQFKTKMTDYFDVLATVLPLGHAFGRVGCFLSGCCYGMEYDGFLSYTYTKALDTSTPIGVPLLPIQLIEATVLLLSFGMMLTIFLKTKKKGFCTLFYASWYAIVRFVLEFFRGDKERGGFLLSTSQWISVGILLVVGLLIFLNWKKSKNAELVTDAPSEAGETVSDDVAEMTETVTEDVAESVETPADNA